MLVRLTSPENFDKLIDFFEKYENLTWEDVPSGEEYRQNFIQKTKEAMKKGPVIIDFLFEYDIVSKKDVTYPVRIEIESLMNEKEVITKRAILKDLKI